MALNVKPQTLFMDCLDHCLHHCRLNSAKTASIFDLVNRSIRNAPYLGIHIFLEQYITKI